MTQIPPGTPTILLVDDEPLILMMAAEILVDAGYDVTPCASAEQALALVADGYRPDILVTDQSMPGISGLELAQRLSRDAGVSAVLIATGGGGVENHGFPTLTKPFREADLIHHIRAIAPPRAPA